jgi:hypothetical protein
MPFPDARGGKSKVESGRPSGGGGEGGGTGESYSALPTEVKQTCERMMTRLKIQPGQSGSVFKDAKAYRDHYAREYFREAE